MNIIPNANLEKPTDINAHTKKAKSHQHYLLPSLEPHWIPLEPPSTQIPIPLEWVRLVMKGRGVILSNHMWVVEHITHDAWRKYPLSNNDNPPTFRPHDGDDSGDERKATGWTTHSWVPLKVKERQIYQSLASGKADVHPVRSQYY